MKKDTKEKAKLILNKSKEKKRRFTIKVWHFGVLMFIAAAFFFIEALSVEHLDYHFPFVGYGGTFRQDAANGWTVPWYELSFGIGVIMMFVICIIRIRRYKLSLRTGVCTAFWLVMIGYSGAKILYILENWSQVRKTGLSFGGVSLFGSLFFVPMVLWVGKFLYKCPYRSFLDYCAPAGILMIACVRLGCFFKGCCGGYQFWIGNRPVILPVQLLECGLDLFLLEWILRLEKRNSLENGRYGVFLLGYGIYRFFLEWIRRTPKDALLFSNGQIFSCVAIVIGSLMISISKSKRLWKIPFGTVDK